MPAERKGIRTRVRSVNLKEKREKGRRRRKVIASPFAAFRREERRKSAGISAHDRRAQRKGGRKEISYQADKSFLGIGQNSRERRKKIWETSC